MRLLFYLWSVFTTLLIKIECQQYELPPIVSSEDRSVRLNEIQEISQPSIMLNKIYRREVYKLQSEPKETNYTMISQFPPCKQTPPEITFKNVGYYHLEQSVNPYSETQTVTNTTESIKKTTSIIYDYEALKIKTQNIIDMVFFDNQIFTISSTGIINVYRLNYELENGIALMMSVKGIDWENLYQIRLDQWKLAEEQQKKRLDLIDEINKKVAEREKKKNQTLSNNTIVNKTEARNDTNEKSPLLGGEQHSLLEELQTNQTNPNLTQKSPSRLLQTIDFNNPSPKVQSDSQISPKVKTNESIDSSDEKSNETYYTGPPPEIIKSHLQKGYFEILEDNKLLIFANSQYLIGFDVIKNQSILFSEQLAFDYLFAEKDTKNSINKTSIQNSTTNNTTNETSTSNKTISNTTTQNKTQNSSETNSSTNTTANNKATSNTNSTTNSTTTPIQPQEPIPPYPEPTPIISNEFAPLSQFQQITKINETHFAIIDKKKGVVIYEILKRRLNTSTQFMNNPESYFIRKVIFLGKEHFGKTYQENQDMNLVDIVYCKNKSLLLVLDYEKGVVAFEKSASKENTTTTNLTTKQKQKPAPLFILSSYTIRKKMCTLMQLSSPSQTLFLSCNKIYRVSLENWPRITEKTYPHPLINIREIFVEEDQDLLILSGYSVFKVMYLDRTTNYFQDDMLDKIIFNKDLVITANQNHIIALKYRVDKPVIMCSTSNKSLLGVHNLVLRTTAQCNEPYLKSINYTKPQGDNDICVYTVYKNIFIWEQGEVPLKPLAIVMLVFLIFIVVMIIWFILIKLRMQNAQQRLKYLSGEGHKELVEEEIQNNTNETKDEKSSEGGRSVEMIEDHKKPQQQDHNKDLYSIE